MSSKKTAREPFFSGQEEDWANFWDDWEDYWGRVASGKVVEETQKVQMFESFLDDVNLRAFVQERKVKVDLTFMQINAKLESRYGRHRQSRLRKAFELLACKDDCDLRDWDSFRTDFKALACELQDTLTPEALQKALRTKLPWKFREWILHIGQDEDSKKHTAEIVFPERPPCWFGFDLLFGRV